MPFSHNNAQEVCLCGSETIYKNCCQPFHNKQSYPETAEQLMRSRYVAYALQLKSYLQETWHISTRPKELSFDPESSWTKLMINGRKKGRKKDSEGWVTFTAFYQVGLESNQLQEKSYFIRDSDQHWCYVDGEIK